MLAGSPARNLKKPFIAAVNSRAEIVPGYIHLQELARAVKEGTGKGGGARFPKQFAGISLPARLFSNVCQ
ncbi:hypothetical protein LR013_00610 [candidate division NPL-UPA2 bacterium]|nr:hypothetical protein [candidate division NPL-UPA2 bacterium]